MSGNRIYASAADHLNYARYIVECAPYAPHSISDEMLELGIIPTYNTPNMHVLQRSTVTINNLVDLYQKNIPFSILTDLDLIVMVQYIEAYFKEVQHKISIPEYQDYLKKLIPFRRSLQKSLMRVMKRNPDWHKKFYGGQNSMYMVMLEFMRIQGYDVNTYDLGNSLADVIEKQIMQKPEKRMTSPTATIDSVINDQTLLPSQGINYVTGFNG